MRKCRYQKGSVKKQRGRWIGMWYADGRRKSQRDRFRQGHDKARGEGGSDSDRRRGQAKREQNRVLAIWRIREQVYFPYYSRKWKDRQGRTT